MFDFWSVYSGERFRASRPSCLRMPLKRSAQATVKCKYRDNLGFILSHEFGLFAFYVVANSFFLRNCIMIYNENSLSYDVAVIQWITSCHKNRMTTRAITLWCVNVTSLTTAAPSMRFLLEILSILNAIKSILKGHMMNRILHSCSFHMKFMKFA